MEYSYSDGDLYYFMDQESYELVPINGSELGDNFKFVKENMVCKILSYKGKVFGVEPPTIVELQVSATDPGFKGDTATNATKPATLETGAEIRVPLFINEGDMIRIDTAQASIWSAHNLKTEVCKMDICEKVAYIKGLAEGLSLDESTKEGKILGRCYRCFE